MEIIEELPRLATLSLEGFPSGDSIRRRTAELTMRMRLSGASESDIAIVGAAADRVMDPLGRFEESIRWLVLPEGTVSRVSATSNVWAQRLAGLRDAVAKHSSPEWKSHNELVLMGLAALVDPTSQPGKAGFQRMVSLSGEVTASDVFWRMVDEHARAIGDPRLASDAVRAARAVYQARALGPALAPIQLELRRYEASGARLALQAVVAAKATDRVLSDIRTSLLGEIVQRCEHALAALEPRAEVTSTRTAHEQVVQAAREQLDRDVGLLAAIGEAGGEFCKRICDSYAELLRTLAIRGVNVHGTHIQSEELIARARSIAVGAALRARLDGDGKTLAENAAFRKCVYCTVAEADGKPVEVSMFRVTERHFRSVSYQSLKVPVPCCKDCASRHSKSNLLNVLCMVTGLGVGIGIGASMDSGSHGRRSGPCGGIVLGGVIGFVAGAVVAVIVRRAVGLGDRGSARDFLPIAKLLAEGWKLGDKPGKTD